MLRNPVLQYFPRPLLSHSSLVTTQLPSSPTPPPLVFFVSRSDLLALTSLLDRPFLPLCMWMLTCVACPPFLPSMEVHPHTPPRPRHAGRSTSASEEMDTRRCTSCHQFRVRWHGQISVVPGGPRDKTDRREPHEGADAGLWAGALTEWVITC